MVTVRVTPDQVVFVLRSGLQLDLGNTHNLPLKLMVGAQLPTPLGTRPDTSI